MAENKLHQATTNKTTTSIATTTGSNSRRMREAAPPGRNKKTLLTVNTAENRAAPPIHNNSKVVKKRDDAISLSSMSKEQKEDDSAYMVRREQQQQTRSRRSRGATPPRPKGIVRTRSHDGSLEPPPRGGAGGVAPRRRSASPNRIPRVPNKPPATAGATATVLASAGDANSTGNNSSPRRLSHTSKDPSSHSLATSGGGSSTGGKQSKSSWQWNPQNTEKNNQEQQLFEQRLCEDAYGVAVRKINQNGKPNLRYVRCLYADTLDNDSTTVGDPSSNRSTGGSSFVRSFRNIKSSSTSNIVSNTAAVRSTNKSRSTSNTVSNTATAGSPNTLTDTAPKRVRVLTWGKKKDVRISLDKFVCVRKGKTTDRARRNANPSCRILSLITTDPNHPSLDIEAPTRLDRDKFARAFARFLDVPLVGEDKTAQSVSPRPSQLSMYKKEGSKTAMSEPDMAPTPKQTIAEAKRIQQQQLQQTNKAPNKAPLPVVTMGGNSNNDIDTSSGGAMIRRHSNPEQQQLPVKHTVESAAGSSSYNPSSHIPDTFRPQVQIASLPDSLRDSERSSTQAATASRPTHNVGEEGDVPHHNLPHYHDDVGDASQVSSLTGIGFDQEIVEELHQALTELKAELEESRAEAARAVKVAEQAIQSAENSNSNDWNSTVTHKAAEAAALAQKRSAEAMAKARLAEERLEGERKTAAFWRRQAEAAEEEAGALQTRAAAAEVQRAAMEEELDSERRKTTALLNSMKSRYASAEQQQKEALEAALERNRTLELELEASRQELSAKNDETVSVSSTEGGQARKKFSLLGRKKKLLETKNDSSKKLLSGIAQTSSSAMDQTDIRESGHEDLAASCLKLHAEAASVRKHFEMLRKATTEELQRLPDDAKMWATQASQAIAESQTEISLLREKLASESAMRRKLLHEVQDLRGVVRIYCRPRLCSMGEKGMLSIPSQETLLLHPYADESPMSFKFDRVFTPEVDQREVYNEIEELCLSVLDGYNICLMVHGQTGSGKTYSMLGDVKYVQDTGGQNMTVEIEDHGVHLKTVQQLFSISEHRGERYQDVFTLDIVEVYNERLCDLLAGTEIGEARGQVTMDDAKSNSRRSRRGMSADDGSSAAPPMHSNSHSVSSKQGSAMTKLEIRTNHNGDTVVQGLLSVEVNSFEDVYRVWQQCLSHRATRLAEQGINVAEYEASSHVIVTLSVVSVNVATGLGSVGKIKFVDLAGADLVHRRGADQKKCPTPDSNPNRSNSEWKYVNRSLATLNDVVNCRSQFMRSVPYRNSTLTHLLRDNLEADTKVLLLLCVSAEPKDLQETACALRFASGMRRVTVGKATKHSLTKM